MRIISKFKDYYDSVQAYGQDERCVYIRKSEKHTPTDKIAKVIGELLKEMPEVISSLDGRLHIIGFCGKLYPVWELNHTPKDLRSYPMGSPTKFKMFAYTAEDIQEFCGHHKELTGTLETFNKKLKKKIFHWRGQNFRFESVSDAVAKIQNSNKLEKLFWTYRTPCFVLGGAYNPYLESAKVYKFITDPCLKDYKFFKVKDTVSAYQDISQYISGILGLNDPEIVHISDKDMKDQKGFGHKYAFKKEPGGRK